MAIETCLYHHRYVFIDSVSFKCFAFNLLLVHLTIMFACSVYVTAKDDFLKKYFQYFSQFHHASSPNEGHAFDELIKLQ